MEETTNSPVSQPSSGGGMNWKVIGGIIAALVVVGVVVFGMGGKSNGPTSEEMKGSLKSLLALESPQKCTVTSQVENSESTGEVMIANGMMRGTFTSTANGQTITSHMIVKDNTNYVWSDAMEQGIKMALDASTAPAGENQQGVDVDQEYTYKCESWTEDATAFELPADVNFIDLAAMMSGNITDDIVPPGDN